MTLSEMHDITSCVGGCLKYISLDDICPASASQDKNQL